MNEIYTFFKIPFILMSNINIGKYNHKLNNEKVFIFDIDDTLYKRSMEIKNKEKFIWDLYYTSMRNKDMPQVSENLSLLQLNNFKLYKFRKDVSKRADESKQREFFTEFVFPDVKLKKLLNNIPFKKFCFTNGGLYRSRTILDIMEITECFDGVFYAENKDFIPIGKPLENSYKFIMDFLSITNPKQIYFFDDLEINISAAKKLGWNAFLIKENDDLTHIVKMVIKNN